MKRISSAALFALLFILVSCTSAPAAVQNPASIPPETAVRQFTTALKDLAGVFELQLLTDKEGSIDYQAMEQAGTTFQRRCALCKP